MVETTAVFLPAEPNFLISATIDLPVGMAERRVVDHDVFVRDALRTSGRPRGSCWSCADRRSRCRPAPSASLRRRPCSSGSRRPGSPAGSARRRCRTRCAGSPRPRTGPGRTGCRSAPRTPAAPTCGRPRSSSRTPRRPCPSAISSRAFSANSGQFDAGSTTTASSFLPSRPPFLFCSSISISMTSFSVVSLIAMVPDSEWRMPTLIVSRSARTRWSRRRPAGPPQQVPSESLNPTSSRSLLFFRRK